MLKKTNWSDLLQYTDDMVVSSSKDDDDVTTMNVDSNSNSNSKSNSFATMLKGIQPFAEAEAEVEEGSTKYKPGWVYIKKNPWGPGVLYQNGPPSNRFSKTKQNQNRYENETKRNKALHTYRIALEQYQMDSLNECLGDLSPYWNCSPAHEKYDAYEDFVASTSRPKRKIKNITK